MKTWKVGLIGTICMMVLNSCGSDPAVVSININSSSIPQVIPPGTKVVVVVSGTAEGAAATDVTGKLLVGTKTFDMVHAANEAFSFTSTSPCADFGKGTQIFKYQLFKSAVLFKEDQLQVTVNC